MDRKQLKDRAKALWSSPFARNSMFTSARSLVTVLLQFIFTPIIVSLYSPEAYGAFGLLFSFSSVALSVATLQYEKAMFLSRDEEEIRLLRTTGNTTALLLAILTTLVLLIGHEAVIELLDASALGLGIFFLPVLILLGATAQTSQVATVVKYKYKKGFVVGSMVNAASKLVAIAYGSFVGPGFLGLLASELFLRGASTFTNVRVILNEPWSSFGRLPRMGDLRRTAVKYKSFPLYDVPALLLNTVSNQFPALWIPKLFGLAAFGQYSLAIGLLGIPLRLFGYSLSGTFYQKAAHTAQERGEKALLPITLSMMRWTGVMGLAPAVIIWFGAEPIFVLIFGEEWSMSGSMAALLTVYFGARLSVEPVISVLRVIRAQRSILVFNLLMVINRAVLTVIIFQQKIDLMDALWYYSITGALGYLMLAVHIIHVLKTRLPEPPPPPNKMRSADQIVT